MTQYRRAHGWWVLEGPLRIPGLKRRHVIPVDHGKSSSDAISRIRTTITHPACASKEGMGELDSSEVKDPVSLLTK